MVDPSPFGRVMSLTVVGEQLVNKAVKHMLSNWTCLRVVKLGTEREAGEEQSV
jgi:hypothetical protein